MKWLLVLSAASGLVIGCASAPTPEQLAAREKQQAEWAALKAKRDALPTTLNVETVRGCKSLGIVDATAHLEKMRDLYYQGYVAPYNVTCFSGDRVSCFRSQASATQVTAMETTVNNQVAAINKLDTLKEETIKKNGNMLLLGADPVRGEAYLCPPAEAK